jgi:hypothetical protein
MEPISLILAALAAGAIAATKDVAGTAVKDAYEGLKALLKKKLEKDTLAQAMVDAKPEDIEQMKSLLKNKIAEAGGIDKEKDAEILKKAEEILKKEDPEGFQGGKYNINISGGTQGVVGENKGTVNIGK